MMKQSFHIVFDALSDTPQEALNMKLRADLINPILELIQNNNWTQKEAAKQLGVTQPRISDLLNEKLSLSSLDMLVNMLASLGKKIKIQVRAA